MESVFYNVDIVRRQHRRYIHPDNQRCKSDYRPLQSIAVDDVEVRLSGTKTGIRNQRTIVSASNMSASVRIKLSVLADPVDTYPCRDRGYLTMDEYVWFRFYEAAPFIRVFERLRETTLVRAISSGKCSTTGEISTRRGSVKRRNASRTTLFR